MERRSKPRIDFPFPTRVRGVDVRGHSFKVDTVVDNISAGGLHVRLERGVREGTSLSAIVRFSTASGNKASAARVSLRGVVVRVEPHADGTYGVAVRVTQHRFL